MMNNGLGEPKAYYCKPTYLTGMTPEEEEMLKDFNKFLEKHKSLDNDKFKESLDIKIRLAERELDKRFEEAKEHHVSDNSTLFHMLMDTVFYFDGYVSALKDLRRLLDED